MKQEALHPLFPIWGVQFKLCLVSISFKSQQI